MRLIMMGTGPFALPTLQALLDSPHEVLALITRPDRARRGSGPAGANPMRAAAEARGLRVCAPESINAPPARMLLAADRPELLVVCDYGQILQPATLEIAPLGGINLHGSLLPKYRGAAPVQWALYRGERETGVSVIHMSPAVDAGAVIAQARTPIGADETAATLEPRLAALGAPLVLEAIAAIEGGHAAAIEQDPAAATRAPRLTKELGAVDWSRAAEEIANQVRALQPWPNTYTLWRRAGQEPLRLILERVRALPAAERSAPGVVLAAEGDRLVVGTGAGELAIERIQPAGKRALSAGEFLRGYRLQPGDQFGA